MTAPAQPQPQPFVQSLDFVDPDDFCTPAQWATFVTRRMEALRLVETPEQKDNP